MSGGEVGDRAGDGGTIDGRMLDRRTGELAGELEQLAVALAEGAGALARAGRASATAGPGLEISAKSTATDLVTEVDRRTERWLVEQLAARRPDDGVLGEEGAGRRGRSGVRWVLDPIDGTVNFVLGLPQWAVSVAAEVDGRVVAGAVCNPLAGETFRARLGGGARLAGADGSRSLTGPRAVALGRAVIGTGFGYDADRRARQAEVLGRVLPLVGDIRRLGAASLDLCAVAAGRLDGYYEAGLNEWDYAAGALIAAEAGCRVRGPDGGPPAAELAAVAPPAWAEEFFALLARVGADRVL